MDLTKKKPIIEILYYGQFDEIFRYFNIHIIFCSTTTVDSRLVVVDVHLNFELKRNLKKKQYTEIKRNGIDMSKTLLTERVYKKNPIKFPCSRIVHEVQINCDIFSQKVHFLSD